MKPMLRGAKAWSFSFDRENMPIIAIAPNDDLVNKLKNNLEEVKARGGKLFIIADQGFELQEDSCTKIITLGDHAGFLSPHM